MAVTKNAVKDIYYVRNLTENPVRIMTTKDGTDISIGPRGHVDVMAVDKETFHNPRFRPSLNKLVEEVDEDTYNTRLIEGFENPTRNHPRSKLAQNLKEINSRKLYSVDPKTGEETTMPVYVERQSSRDRDEDAGGQSEIDAPYYAGAERVVGTAPDPAGGKTLSESRGL